MTFDIEHRVIHGVKSKLRFNYLAFIINSEYEEVIATRK